MAKKVRALLADGLQQLCKVVKLAHFQEKRRRGHAHTLPLADGFPFPEGDGRLNDEILLVAHIGDNERVQGREVRSRADATPGKDVCDLLRGILRQHVLFVARVAEYVRAPGQGAKYPPLGQPLQVFFPEHHILLGPLRYAVRLVRFILLAQGARLAQVERLAVQKRGVNLGQERHVEEVAEPVEHKMRTLKQKDALGLGHADDSVTDELLLH